jgi:hypothetical protein
MLTYSHVCCAFSSARALSLNAICIFEMAFSCLIFKCSSVRIDSYIFILRTHTPRFKFLSNISKKKLD